MDLKRRDFLRTTLAGVGGASAALGAARALAQADAPVKEPKYPFSTDPVAKIKLTADIESSRLGFGTGMSGYNHSAQLTRMDRDKAVAMLNHAYDRGIRFFDCADLYGTHEIVSSTLKDKPRDSYVLSTKLWPHGGGIQEKERPSADVVVKRFLKELNTDYIDLVQVHCMMKPDWKSDFQQYCDDLEKLKEQGLIRGHGISIHSLGALRNGAEDPWVDAMHIRINQTGARMEGSFEENVAAAKIAQENGKGIIAMKLIGEGTIRDLEERRKNLEAVVRSGVVDVYIVGFEEMGQIDEFIDNMSLALNKIDAEQKQKTA